MTKLKKGDVVCFEYANAFNKNTFHVGIIKEYISYFAAIETDFTLWFHPKEIKLYKIGRL